MKSKLLKHLKVIFGTCACVAVFSQAPASAQVIEELEFEVTYPEPDKVKVTFSAQASGGVSIGSYAVRLREVMPAKPLDGLGLPGTTYVNGNLYLTGRDFPDNSALLKDNGYLDEDERVGVFSTTLDASQWPQGRYIWIIAATNRPGTGDYHHITRAFTVNVGDKWKEDAGFVSNLPNATHIEIYKKNGIYATFPTLTRLEDGRFVTTFDTRVRMSHIDPTGGSQRLASSDGGETWEPYSGETIRPDSRAADGTIVTSQVAGWIYVPESERDRLVNEGRTVMDAMEGKIAYMGGASFSVSRDDGRSWETHEIEVPGDISGLYNHHYDASNVRTKDGLRLNAIYGRRKPVNGIEQKDEVFFLRSADDGKTWALIELTPGGLPDAELGFNETALAELPDGSVLAAMRTTAEAELYTSVSRDGGLTWSDPVETPMWGFPADLLVLPDGRLLCVYGRRKAPYGIRACVSHDNGATWDIENELILRADGLVSEGGDMGYPLVELRDDGKLFVIYYIATDGGMPGIEGTIFAVPTNVKRLTAVTSHPGQLAKP